MAIASGVADVVLTPVDIPGADWSKEEMHNDGNSSQEPPTSSSTMKRDVRILGLAVGTHCTVNGKKFVVEKISLARRTTKLNKMKIFKCKIFCIRTFIYGATILHVYIG